MQELAHRLFEAFLGPEGSPSEWGRLTDGEREAWRRVAREAEVVFNAVGSGEPDEEG